MASFNELETGRESRPVDLYRFDYGAEVFRFTSGDSEITFDGVIYTPLQIKRSTPTLNPRNKENNKIKLEAPADERPFEDFVSIQPAERLECLITRIQLDESISSPLIQSPEVPPAPTTGFIIFDGFVTSISFSGRTCSIDMNPFNDQFGREVPRYKYQGICNHVLYDSACQVDPNSFSQTGTVNGVDGNTITVSGFSGSAFTGGYVRNESGTDYRMIIQHSGDSFTMLLPFRESILGSEVTAFQGCDHSVETCRDKFSNVANFGGYPLIPGINPFTQGQLIKV